MADTIRGDGLFRAHGLLATLNEDSQLLDQARRRFSESPPSYRSHKSNHSTLSQSPDPTDDEHQCREAREGQLESDYWASTPFEQFDAQVAEELKRILEANANWTYRQPVGTDFSELADENVIKDWREQGIWDEKWKTRTLGRWKHERPLELEQESKDADNGAEASLLGSQAEEAKSGQPKISQAAEQQRLREREASRPYHQFVHQVSKERERIRDNLSVQGTPFTVPPDINTTAYENVKHVWIKRGIWNKKWNVLPGMSWKHERPLQEFLNEEMGEDLPVPTNEAENGTNGTRYSPPTRIFGSIPPQSNYQASSPSDASAQLEHNGHATGEEAPPRHKPSRSLSPAEPSQDQASGILSPFAQPSSTAIDAAGLPNGNNNASHSSSAPNPRNRSRFAPPRKRARTANRTCSSKVSKAKRSRPSPRRQRRLTAADLPSEVQQSLFGPDVPELLPQAATSPPRRSKRLEAKRETAVVPVGVSPATSPKASRSKAKNSSTGDPISANLQRISKRQRSL